jgi:hypothetical protein
MKRFVVYLAIALLAVGCAAALDVAVRVVNTSHEVLVQAHDALDKLDRAERDAALALSTSEADARKRTDVVAARYAPAWDAYARASLAWLAARAAVEAAVELDAAGKPLDEATITKALAAAGDAWTAFQAALAPLQLPAPAMPASAPPAPATVSS